MPPRQLIVLALGGNSIIRDEAHLTVPDQWELMRETCFHIARIIGAGHNVVITHGNGPQVGFILRRSELARHELHDVPLDLCDADTQGSIGYMIQQSLSNSFRTHGVNRMAVSVVTQVVVAEDPARGHASKPIGALMDEATARERVTQNGWAIAESHDHRWQRVVPSPEPIEIVELDAIRHLVNDGFVVTAVGGGGIPVVRNPSGDLRGVEAVVDKDLASVLLAQQLDADLFVISTAVRKVCLNFGKPDQRELDSMTLAEAKRYLAQGHFGAGTMKPKIQAIVKFLEGGGKKAIITRPADLEDALAGTAGTTIVAA